MDVAQLHPSRARAYSTNLHRWLRMRSRQCVTGGMIADHVFRVTAESALCRRYGFAVGELVIGLPYKDPPFAKDFGGVRLIQVLVLGSEVDTMCHLGGAEGLEHVADFWERYAAIGRCVIDPQHTEHFIDDGDRFIVRGDHRSCRWCGAEQHKAIRTKVVEVETWEPAAACS
ncbi:hypothetical protein AB7849_09490 [Rhodanobacter sp. 115]